MKKCKYFCCEYMLGMLAEGLGEIYSLRDEIRESWKICMAPEEWSRANPELSEFKLEVRLGHAYHHINWTWGCRHAPLERARKSSWRDFKNWEKFPLAFRELLRDRPVRAVETHSNTILHPESMMLGIEPAIKYGEELLSGMAAHFTKETCPLGWEEAYATAKPIDEERLVWLLRHLLAEVNFIWNVRRIAIERVWAMSERSRRLRKCYPMEFGQFLTKRHFKNR